MENNALATEIILLYNFKHKPKKSLVIARISYKCIIRSIHRVIVATRCCEFTIYSYYGHCMYNLENIIDDVSGFLN